jgi:hypothetical protein
MCADIGVDPLACFHSAPSITSGELPTQPLGSCAGSSPISGIVEC